MKAFLMMAILFGTALAHANEVSYGYVFKNQGRTLSLSYMGITEAGTSAGFTLNHVADSLSDEQITTMLECSSEMKKWTHALRVEKFTERFVRTLPGNSEPATETRSEFKISCVDAPGFLGQWRKIYKMEESN